MSEKTNPEPVFYSTGEMAKGFKTDSFETCDLTDHVLVIGSTNTVAVCD